MSVRDSEDQSDLETSGVGYASRQQSGNRYNNSTAGNEADIEDNLNQHTVDPEEVLKKLRAKCPEECRAHTVGDICFNRYTPSGGGGGDGGGSGGGGGGEGSSAFDRLSTRPKSALTALTETIGKPKGAVPPLALPTWHCLPLDQKIPLLPAPPGFMYYSPGKLGIELDKKHKIYSVADPYNRERTAKISYTALTDPHARSFVQNPLTKRLLNDQGLLNEHDEVIFSLMEFNKYRDYLRTIVLDEAHQSTNQSDELTKMDREQARVLRQTLSVEEGPNADRRKRFAASKKAALNAEELKLNQLKNRIEQNKMKVEMFEKERFREKVAKMMKGAEQSNYHLERKLARDEARRKQQARMFQKSMLKDLKNLERIREDRELMKRANLNYRLEWVNAKIDESKARAEKEQAISKSTKETLKKRAEQRQHKLEVYRKNLPERIEKRKEKQEHLWKIVRKYFNIWLQKTRDRKNSPADEAHESAWIRGISGPLEETVQFLRFQTDTHAKLDNFILSILRLKEAIKKQLELEGDDDSDDGGGRRQTPTEDPSTALSRMTASRSKMTISKHTAFGV